MTNISMANIQRATDLYKSTALREVAPIRKIDRYESDLLDKHEEESADHQLNFKEILRQKLAGKKRSA